MTAGRDCDTRPPSTGPGEREVLAGFLGYLRRSVAAKAEGVPEERAAAPGVPSGTSLLGLVKHLTCVERYWLLAEEVPDWPGTFHPAPGESAESLLAGYRRTTAETDRAIAAWDDLGMPGPRPAGHGGRRPSRRWTLTHLIEETARHAGHADILRELIDGSTGR